MPPRPRIAGHRGCGSNRAVRCHPENTLPSFLAAVHEGADMVELDVQLTADGHVVVIHDAKVDRTTDGRGCVQALALAEVRRLDAGHGIHPGGGIRVPTLEEVVAQVGVLLNVEVKLHRRTRCPAQDPERLAHDVARVLEALPPDRAPLVSSFDLEVLRRLRVIAPGLRLGYITDRAEGFDTALREGMAAHLADELVTEARVRRLHDAGLEANVWTVDDEGRARELFDLGVDTLITDHPGRMRRLRDGA